MTLAPLCRAAALALLLAPSAGCAAGTVPPPEAPQAEPGNAPASDGAARERSLRRREQGRASYYSDRLKGHRTASGERYDPRALTAAHRTLPFGAVVDVIRRDGRSVRVRINDRGPFTKGRIIDLSRRAAEAIGLLREGVAEVTLVLVSMPSGSRR